MLTGTEVKSLRQGRASLIDGYAVIEDGEAWLMGVHIPEYTEGTWNNHAPRRQRKLLLHKEEIIRLQVKTKESGLALVPLQLYFKRRARQGRDRPRSRSQGARQAPGAVSERDAKREIAVAMGRSLKGRSERGRTPRR